MLTISVAAYFPIMDWQQNKRNSDSELNDFFLSTVPAQYFRPNDSENGDDSTKNCLATNVIITSPGRCALTQRLMNNVYSFYRETYIHSSPPEMSYILIKLWLHSVYGNFIINLNMKIKQNTIQSER